ncbi:MAG: 2-amino-4-hydroxy-6-hydroxymethyldihydropteridine diphosphokinase [SAR202 cluster bacterium]|nr:2-amino-4-hydroxy-6-hydroxymethyldihydropteridine diphosphokinase [SAR202 cluster bacterium]
MRHDAYLGLGSNMGDRLGYLRAAVRELAAISEKATASSAYETEPVGITDQPLFLNAVCHIVTRLDPWELLDTVRGIEAKYGRQRTVVGGPRTLDIDILLYDGLVMETPELTIPHPRMHQRAFVLVPLVEIAPDVVHPELKATVSALLAKLREPRGVGVRQPL